MRPCIHGIAWGWELCGSFGLECHAFVLESVAVALVLRYLRRLRSSAMFISFMFALLKKK
jgi:hypothetical protein